MKPCINCRIFDPRIELNELLEAVGYAGFTSVEFRIQQVQKYLELNSIEGARASFKSRNITPFSFIDLLPPGLLALEEKYQNTLDELENKCAVAKAVGCNNASITINPRTSMPREVAYQLAVKRLQHIADIANEFDVTLAIEALGIKEGISARLDGPNYFMDRYSQVVDLMTDVNRSNVGVLLDVFHWHTSKGTLEEIEEAPFGAISLIHISDSPPGFPEKIQDKDRVLPGQGVVNIISLLRAARKKGYDNFVSLELFNQALDSQEQQEIARRGYNEIEKILKNLYER